MCVYPRVCMRSPFCQVCRTQSVTTFALVLRWPGTVDRMLNSRTNQAHLLADAFRRSHKLWYIAWKVGFLSLTKQIESRFTPPIIAGPSPVCVVLCQFSGGVDWRSRLDSQRGAVLATELKNNSCKLAKWTVSAILAGSDQIKFGWVNLSCLCVSLMRNTFLCIFCMLALDLDQHRFLPSMMCTFTGIFLY